MEQILLRNWQSPGDIIALTAACRDLALAYPNHYKIHVSTNCLELWNHNPHVTVHGISPHARIDGIRNIACHYPVINQSNRLPRHFIEAFHRYLEIVLSRPIPITEFKGDLYLSEKEKNEYPVKDADGKPLRYWVVVAGGKLDFSAKWLVPKTIEDALMLARNKIGPGRMKWVQIGASNHWHQRLHGEDIIDMVGKTSLRDVLQLIYHADGVLCPVTFAMHAAAAVPIKRPPLIPAHDIPPSTPENLRPGLPLRPCVVVAGAREPAHWEQYPGHRFLENVGSMWCGSHGGCWRSRAQKINDGDEKDSNHVCLNTVERNDWKFAKCIDMIAAADIAMAMLSYYEGGALEYPKE